MMTTKQRESRHSELYIARSQLFNFTCMMRSIRTKSKQELSMLKKAERVMKRIEKMEEQVMRLSAVGE